MVADIVLFKVARSSKTNAKFNTISRITQKGRLNEMGMG